MVLDALGRNGRLEDALKLFDKMCVKNDPPWMIAVNLGIFNVTVDAYYRAERFRDAIEVFGKMVEKRCAPDALSYNNLIDWLGKNELVGEAVGLYKEMAEQGVNPDEYTYVLLIESCFIKMNRMDYAIGYFNKMFDAGLRPDANAFNKVMGGLVKVDRLDKAQGFFGMMPENEVKPNIASYELLLRAYLDAARLGDAIKITKGILLDKSVVFSDEMRTLLDGALEKEGRDGGMTKLYEDVERDKAEAAARAAEAKAKAEALAKEEGRKNAEAKAKEEAAARVSRAAIEAVLGRKREADKEESADGLNVEEAEVVVESDSNTIGVSGEQSEGDEQKKQGSVEAS